jgi:transcriptional regulator with XRE-family HTH domain
MLTRRTRRSRKSAVPGDIADQLGDARRSIGLTQRELAQRLGVSQAQVARLEQRGYTAHTLRSLRRYVGALGEGFRLAIAVRHGDTPAEGAGHVAAPR